MASDVDGQPLVRPPRLRTGQEATASRLELFFDLAYVLVVLELASTFSRAPRDYIPRGYSDAARGGLLRRSYSCRSFN